jgi:acylphosphatase
MTTTIAIEARIRGRVQGVAFRAWTRAQAEKLGLRGWVVNNADGSVSALFIGPRDRVDDMTGQLWRGPGAAVVDDVATRTVDLPPEAPEGFTILR